MPDGASGPEVSEYGVLHWDGQRWTREQIEIPGENKKGFRVLAIGASSPANAWLLGQLPAGGVALFRRHGEGKQGEGEASWKPVAPSTGGVAGEALSAEGDPFSVAGMGQAPTVKAQILTVTEQGVWIDGERTDVHADLTMFFTPEGQDSGRVSATWCNLPAGAAAASRACRYGLPEELPDGTARSFAWADPSTLYGQRVITGLPEDVSLRLEGNSFKRVLALGAHESNELGAAFSEPREGWLGDAELPVHLTLHPAASQLEPYPVPFRYALLAIAPQPGAPVGALSSQALAVGNNGEVARYMPGEGWQPESLIGAGGRRSTPACAPWRGRLRAAHTPSANSARCGCGAPKQGCGNPIPPRRATSAATCSGSPSIQTTRPGIRRWPAGSAVALRQELDSGSAPPGSRRGELHLDRVRGLRSDRRLQDPAPHRPQR